MKPLKTFLRATALSLPLILAACGGDDDSDNQAREQIAALETQVAALETSLATIGGDGSQASRIADLEAELATLQEQIAILQGATTATYEVSVINTTNNQPLSPVGVVLHTDTYSAWSIGEAASNGLERLAEQGTNAEFLAEATTAVDTVGGSNPVGPGGSASYEVSGVWQNNLRVTVASMLVNTNDAYTGVTGWSVADLDVGETISFLAPVYDAGTETNDEMEGTIPGPADEGEGYNPAREANDIVTRHPGVVTADDGYAESILDESHRFDNGSMLIKVTRTL